MHTTVVADEMRKSLWAAPSVFRPDVTSFKLFNNFFACMYSFSVTGGAGCRAVCTHLSDSSGFHLPPMYILVIPSGSRNYILLQ